MLLRELFLISCSHSLMHHKRIMNCKTSRLEVFCRKGVLRNFAKFTGKYLCQCLFFYKTAGLRHLFLTEHLRWLLQELILVKYSHKRSSRLQMFFETRVLKKFANFTGKNLCWSLFLVKSLLKRDSNTGVFPWTLRNF